MDMECRRGEGNMGGAMRLRITLMLLFLASPTLLRAATITAENGGGNWSTTTTWVGGVVPDPGTDTVIIPAALTAPVVLNDSRIIPTTTVEDEVYGLVQGPGVVTTLGGALTIGNGTGKDGAFTFGQGSTLGQGSNHVILGNCKLRSNATAGAGNWAIVTGSGNWQTHGTVTGPKQDLMPRYVSWQNTGTLLFAFKPTGTGAVSNQADFQHVVFHGTGAITFGADNTGAVDATRIFRYIDFRNLTGDLLFTGLAGTSNPLPIFESVTLSNVTMRNWRANRLNGWSIKGNVFDNVTYGIGAAATSGANTVEGNIYIHPSTASGGTNYAAFSSGQAASTLNSNYSFADYANPHEFSFSGSGGSGTFQITNNVFEETGTAVEGNPILPGTLATNIDGNLLIGPGTLGTFTTAVTGAGVTVKNNTKFVTDNSADAYGHMLLFETTGNYTGQLKLSSNLVAYKSGVSPAAASRFATNNTATIPITIDYGDYNAYPSGLSEAYRQLTVINTGHDLVGGAPQFVDPDRNLAKWGQVVHGTDGTVAAIKAKLLAINGYNSTTKTQSDAPSGAVIYGTDTALVNWVRAGFAPTNPILKTSGEGGAYIGAIDVVALGNPAALLMVQ